MRGPLRSTVFPYTTLFRSALGLIFYLAPSLFVGRGVLGLAGIFAFSGLALTRLAFLRVVDEDIFKRRVLVWGAGAPHEHRSEEHTSELQSLTNLVCRLLLENAWTA